MSDEEHNTDKVENPHENAQGTQKLAFLGKKWWFSGFFRKFSAGIKRRFANWSERTGIHTHNLCSMVVERWMRFSKGKKRKKNIQSTLKHYFDSMQNITNLPKTVFHHFFLAQFYIYSFLFAILYHQVALQLKKFTTSVPSIVNFTNFMKSLIMESFIGSRACTCGQKIPKNSRIKRKLVKLVYCRTWYLEQVI